MKVKLKAQMPPRNKPLSLHPLSLEDAIKTILQAKPIKLVKPRRKSRKVSS